MIAFWVVGRFRGFEILSREKARTRAKARGGGKGCGALSGCGMRGREES